VHRNSGCPAQAIPPAVDHSRTRPAAKVPEAAAVEAIERTYALRTSYRQFIVDVTVRVYFSEVPGVSVTVGPVAGGPV